MSRYEEGLMSKASRHSGLGRHAPGPGAAPAGRIQEHRR